VVVVDSVDRTPTEKLRPQKVMFMPTSARRGFCTYVGCW
jgi:hypothetical protein